MHTYLLLTDVTRYQSIMHAAHSIDLKCMLALLMVDTVTAHMMYITSMNMLSIDRAYNA